MKQSSKIQGLIILSTLILILTAGCQKQHSLNYLYNTAANAPAQYPDVYFAVITDTHVYTHELGSSGSAFDKAMASDRKLLLDSIDLLDFAIEEIIASGARFVLIPGDLTKDGELVNHLIMAEKLKKLTDNDIAVFVVPGNHDVNCPDAVRYIGDKTENVQNVSEQEFAQIYADFGYNSALMRDTSSLSYVAEPIEGLWVLAIDAVRHRENVPGQYAIISGRIKQETADWMAEVLLRAAKDGKAVIAIMHHGFMEHWKGQAKLHPDYIIQDYKNFGKFLASWDVRVAFSGHYHAQDITRADFDGKFLYDIQTGSLVTAPCPIRYVNISNNTMQVRSDFIVGKLYPGTSFAADAHAFVKMTVMLEAAATLRKFRVSEKDIAIIADAVGDAFSAHYAGDENPSLRPPLNKSKLGLWGRFVLGQQNYVLDGLWQDLYPADNNVDLPL